MWDLLHSWPPLWSPSFPSAGGCLNLDVEEINTQEWIVWQSLPVPAPSSVIHFSNQTTAVVLRQSFHWSVVSFKFLTLSPSLVGKGFVVIFPVSLPPMSDPQNDLIEPTNLLIQVHIHIYANVFERGLVTFKYAAFYSLNTIKMHSLF